MVSASRVVSGMSADAAYPAATSDNARADRDAARSSRSVSRPVSRCLDGTCADRS